MLKTLRNIELLALLILFFTGCTHSPAHAPVKDPAFSLLDPSHTGLDFSNTLHPNANFNVFDYMYFYNGGGVCAGDFNNDGKIDLFFTANQGDNKLYLNTGNLHFKDVTTAAHIPQDSGWSTGASVIDINNDGLLDIYICRVGKLDGLPLRHNLLLVCQGIGPDGVPTYAEMSKEYGLDFCGFSTQAAFLDYDGDGDLDMYLLNHTLRQNGTYGPRKERLASFNPASGDRLFRNDGNNHFTDVTKEAGINSSVIGYGLGVCISDINLDGYPDIYVGNDFHENDYLYINQHNGRFTDESTDKMMHTSQFSMGVDIADANNDGLPEIVSMDMLPYDPYILRRSEGEDTWDIFNMKISYGYSYQYTRNNLQFNRGNGHFSEVGLYSGIAATDWSWCPLWMDFDNDGLKDLFISNGIPKRLNDIDYINFVSNQELQQKMLNKTLDEQDLNLMNRFPAIKLPSKFFRNDGQMAFTDMQDSIEGSIATYSNGATYADLDNDGDLDLVVNTIDGPALLYENHTDKQKNNAWIDLVLKGPEKNVNALGAKAILFCGDHIRTYEKYPIHGFLSSTETPLHIGLKNTSIDSMFLVWPDNTYESVEIPGYMSKSTFSPQQSNQPTSLSAHRMQITYKKGLPPFNYSRLTAFHTNPTRPMEDITATSGLNYLHKENNFHEFDREPLIPHMLSTEGPALAVEDINKDGLQDVFIGASKWEKSAVFLQNKQGRFVRTSQPALEKDSTYEDVGACWTDLNNDGTPDLVVASGGNEFYGRDTFLTPRVYLNDGKGMLHKRLNAFDTLFVNASCVAPFDFNGDGHPDLFIGGRSVPFNYGMQPRSYLLMNDGTGKFTDVTEKYAPGLQNAGFVTQSLWFDLDKNGEKDLILCLEWGGIVAWMNHQGHFTKKMLCDKKGWWNFILPVDLDNDGDYDLIAGNLGLNSRLKASDTQPVRLYYSDFDDNGKKEQILTYYINGRELPFANKEELEHQIPLLKKQFPYAEDFAKASLNDIFPTEKLSKADTLTANYFSNAVLINDGHENFTLKALPWEAQLTPYRDAVVVDANGDNLPDILLAGNYYDNNIQMGRYDADYGSILLNKGNDEFQVYPLNGVLLKGQVRHIQNIQVNGKNSLIIARNNDSARIIRFIK